MTRLTLAGVAAGLVLAALSTQIAGAAPITRTFAFSASGFTPVIGSDPAPIASVSGSFTVTFDPAGGNVTNVTSGITGTVTPSLGSPIGFNYFPGSSLMDIGATVVGAGAIGVSADDFVLRILGPETASPTFGIFRYSRATDSTTYWGASQGSVTLATVAEPGTVAVLGLGLAGLCFTRRRRRTA